MAKKAKATKQSKPKPTYLKGTRSVDIPVHRVADVLSMIHEHGQTAKFKRQAKAAGHAMTLKPDAVNFVKDFVANNAMDTNAVGKQVMNSDGSYDCSKL